MGVSILNKNGVYNIDRRMLMNDYLIDCLDEYFEALDQMMDKLDQITQTRSKTESGTIRLFVNIFSRTYSRDY